MSRVVRRGGRSRRWLRNRYISTYVDSPNRNVPAETLNADTKCHAHAPGHTDGRCRRRDDVAVQIGLCGGKITIRQVGNVSLPSAITSILWNRRVVPNYLANGSRSPWYKGGPKAAVHTARKMYDRSRTRTERTSGGGALVSSILASEFPKATLQSVYQTVQHARHAFPPFWEARSIPALVRLSAFHLDVTSPITKN